MKTLQFKFAIVFVLFINVSISFADDCLKIVKHRKKTAAEAQYRFETILKKIKEENQNNTNEGLIRLEMSIYELAKAVGAYTEAGIDNSQIVNELAGFVDNSYPIVRIATAYILGTTDNSKALQHLKKMQNDKSELVRITAAVSTIIIDKNAGMETIQILTDGSVGKKLKTMNKDDFIAAGVDESAFDYSPDKSTSPVDFQISQWRLKSVCALKNSKGDYAIKILNSLKDDSDSNIRRVLN